MTSKLYFQLNKSEIYLEARDGPSSVDLDQRLEEVLWPFGSKKFFFAIEYVGGGALFFSCYPKESLPDFCHQTKKTPPVC